MKILKFLARALIYIVLIAVMVFVAFPLLSVIGAAFKSNMEILTMPEVLFPKKPTVENFVLAWNSEVFNVPRMLFNSIWYTVSSVVITLFSSALCGYVFARGEFRGKKTIFAVFTSLMFISMGSITIYPSFEILSGLGLTGSLAGLLVMTCFGIPVVNMHLVRGFVNSLPKEIDEAAEIDGCGFTGRFFKIILPMFKPIIATIAILAFNSAWNDYLMPTMFTLSNPKQHTLIIGIMALKSSGQGATSWNLMFAGTFIALIPVLVIFAIGNKYITKGIAAGAVKG